MMNPKLKTFLIFLHYLLAPLTLASFLLSEAFSGVQWASEQLQKKLKNSIAEGNVVQDKPDDGCDIDLEEMDLPVSEVKGEENGGESAPPVTDKKVEVPSG